MQLYRVTPEKKLVGVPAADAIASGLKETSDMETWLCTQSTILDREKILWISRQERTSTDERADLLGINEDELLVVELKRGSVEKEAVAQGLSYLARHANSERPELLELFTGHTAKVGPWALVPQPLTEEQAEERFVQFAPAGVVLNQYRTLALVGTEFDPETLQVCNLLNESLGAEGVMTIECWRMQLFADRGEYLCAFDKLLPSKDVEDEIATRREERRAGKYKRDPNRIAFMTEFKGAAANKGWSFRSNRGESYECRMEVPNNPSAKIRVNISDRPWIAVTAGIAGFNYSALKAMSASATDKGDHWVVGFPSPMWEQLESRKGLCELILKAITALNFGGSS